MATKTWMLKENCSTRPSLLSFAANKQEEAVRIPMYLYLVQHAEAKTEAEDPSRPLSNAGQAAAARMGKLIQNLRPSVAAIWHSDKLRARQTAEVFSTSVAARDGLQQKAALAPLDDVAPIVAQLQQHKKNLMIVGHLPHLSKLASTLLAGDPERKVVNFQMAGIVCLLRDDDNKGNWSLQWMLTPDVASAVPN